MNLYPILLKAAEKHTSSRPLFAQGLFYIFER